MKQQTIKTESHISGKGIHTGREATVRFVPAQPNSGIIFIRTDLKNAPEISARLENVVDTERATTLASENVRVRTVEHVLAAVFGLGISNLTIEIDAEELPIMDGSSKIYYETLLSSGLEEQSEESRRCVIQKEMSFSNSADTSWIRIKPCDEFQITYHLNYADWIKQYYTYTFSPATFFSEIAPARTFSLLSELEHLLKKGMLTGIKEAAGFALVDDKSKLISFRENFSVDLDKFHHFNGGLSIISKEKLRFPDEMARHKILDIIGDFALSGYYIKGHIEAFGTGHSENIGLMKILFGSDRSL